MQESLLRLYYEAVFTRRTRSSELQSSDPYGPFVVFAVNDPYRPARQNNVSENARCFANIIASMDRHACDRAKELGDIVQ